MHKGKVIGYERRHVLNATDAWTGALVSKQTQQQL